MSNNKLHLFISAAVGSSNKTFELSNGGCQCNIQTLQEPQRRVDARPSSTHLKTSSGSAKASSYQHVSLATTRPSASIRNLSAATAKGISAINVVASRLRTRSPANLHQVQSPRNDVVENRGRSKGGSLARKGCAESNRSSDYSLDNDDDDLNDEDDDDDVDDNDDDESSDSDGEDYEVPSKSTPKKAAPSQQLPNVQKPRAENVDGSLKLKVKIKNEPEAVGVAVPDTPLKKPPTKESRKINLKPKVPKMNPMPKGTYSMVRHTAGQAGMLNKVHRMRSKSGPRWEKKVSLVYLTTFSWFVTKPLNATAALPKQTFSA